jgi:hypothetical protein
MVQSAQVIAEFALWRMALLAQRQGSSLNLAASE